MTTYAEIQKKIAELQAQAEGLRAKEVAEVVSDIKAKIALYGLRAEDLGFTAAGAVAVTTKGKKKELKAKYRDDATGETWVGRGARPKWLQAHIEAGRDQEEFRIQE